jgi:hypothetical protein
MKEEEKMKPIIKGYCFLRNVTAGIMVFLMLRPSGESDRKVKTKD